MPKHSRSSTSNPQCNKSMKRDGSFAYITEIDKHEGFNSCCSHNEFVIEDSVCKKYYTDNKDLIHLNTITEVEVVLYLNTRIANKSNLDSLKINSNEDDCIIINQADNSF